MSSAPVSAYFQSAFRCIAPNGSSRVYWVKEKGVHARKPRPGKRKIWIKLHRLPVKTDRVPYEVGRSEPGGAWLRASKARPRR